MSHEKTKDINVVPFIEFIKTPFFTDQLREALSYYQYYSLIDSNYIQMKLTGDHKATYQTLLNKVTNKIGWIQTNYFNLDTPNITNMFFQEIYAQINLNLEYYKILINTYNVNKVILADKPILDLMRNSNVKRDITSLLAHEAAKEKDPLKLLRLYCNAFIKLEMLNMLSIPPTTSVINSNISFSYIR